MLLIVLKNNFSKLMINSVYGKTMEDVRLVNNGKYFLKHTSRPIHITHKIFDKSYAAIHEIKPVLTFKKLVYVGFAVLELSKWLMYDFHYNFLKKKFDPELLFTDTDSLMKMFMQNFLGTSNCFTLAIFRKTLSFMILKMKWSLAK